MRRSFVLPLAVAALGYASVSLVGGMLTDIGPWYRSLVKPSWQPPDWLFGPVWTMIFILAAVSAALAWRAAGPGERRTVVILFVSERDCSMSSGACCFSICSGRCWPASKSCCCGASIVALIWYVQRDVASGSVLLVPYLLWVSFATILNWTIVSAQSVSGTIFVPKCCGLFLDGRRR